jgi:hypothetical protein
MGFWRRQILTGALGDMFENMRAKHGDMMA